MQDYLAQFQSVETKIGLLSLVLFLVFYSIHNFYKNSLIDLIGVLVNVPKAKEARVFNLIYYILILIFFVIALLLSVFAFGFIDTEDISGKENIENIENINAEGNVSITSGTSLTVNIISAGLELKTGEEEKLIISGIEITEEFLSNYDSELKEALADFKINKNFDAALGKLKELRQKSQKNIDPVSAEGLRGLITASLYTQNKNIDGILDICTNYYNNNSKGQSYLFDIHAHMRSIAIREGYDRAFNVYESMKTDCLGGDMSPVWIGIPLGKMEDLKHGFDLYSGDFGHIRISSRDQEVLKFVLSEYANDKHSSYALYFLKDFETLYERYPDSSLVEVAQLSQINDSSLSLEERYSKLRGYVESYGRNRRISRIVSRLTTLAGRQMYLPWKTKVESLGIPFHIHATNFSESFSNSIESKLYEISIGQEQESPVSYADIASLLDEYKEEYGQYYFNKIAQTHSGLLGVLGRIVEYRKLAIPDEFRMNSYETFVDGISIYCKKSASSEDLGVIIENISIIRKQLTKSSFPGVCYERYALNLGKNFDPKYIEFKKSISLSYRIDRQFFRGISMTLKLDSSMISQFLDIFGADIDIHERQYVSAISNALMEAGLLSELEELYFGTESEAQVAHLFYDSFDWMLSIYSLEEIFSFAANSELAAIYFLEDDEVMSAVNQDLAFNLISRWGVENYSGKLIHDRFKGFFELIVSGELQKSIDAYEDVKSYLNKFNISVPERFEIVNDSVKAALERSDKIAYDLKEFRLSVGARTVLRKYALRGTGSTEELTNALTELNILRTCIDQNVGDNVCLYFRGVFYKNSGLPRMAERDFIEYISTDGNFKDDALAELGLIYLEHYNNVDQARIYFKKVYTDYSDLNAADNALYWLGRYYEGQGNLDRAYYYYFKIATTYSVNRLASISNHNIDRILASINGEHNLRKIKSIRKLKYDEDKEYFIVDEVANNSDFASGDIVIQIEGIELSGLDSYSQILSDFSQIGNEVQVLISRDGQDLLLVGEVERGGIRKHVYSLKMVLPAMQRRQN